MKASRFQLRPTEIGDAASLNEIYFRVSGVERTELQWRWEWLEGPWGASPSWVIVDSSSGRIAGHHGVVPMQLRHPDGRILLGARTENTMIGPEFRSQFAYPAFEAAILRQLLERFDVIFTTAGKGAQAAVRKRLGYGVAGRWVSGTFGTHPFYRLAALMPGWPRGLVPAARIPDGWFLEITDDVQRISTLCMGVQNAAVTAARSADLLRWRFLRHPYHRYTLGILRNDGIDAGYVVFRHQRRGGAVDVVVDDLVLTDSRADRLDACLRTIVGNAATGPGRLVLRACGSGPLAALLSEHADRQAQGDTELLVRWRAGGETAAWDVTPVLSQGI